MSDPFSTSADATSATPAGPSGTPPRRGWRIRGVWVFIIVASTILLARGLLTPASPTAPTANSTPGAGTTATALPAAPEVGHLAPNVILLDLAGHQEPLASFRGKVVVLNFWYIACDPCRYEMPLIEKVYHAHTDQGLVVIGLNMTDGASDITSYIHAIGVDYTILRDSEQRAVVAYNIVATPTTYVIDRQGVIRAKFVGALTDSATLERAVGPLLAAS